MAYFPPIRSDSDSVLQISTTTLGTSSVLSSPIDVKDYSDFCWFVKVPNKGGATSITVGVIWERPSGLVLGQQGVEQIAASGESTPAEYSIVYDVSSKTGTFFFPAMSLPVAGPSARLFILSDDGTATCQVEVSSWRKA